MIEDTIEFLMGGGKIPITDKCVIDSVAWKSEEVRIEYMIMSYFKETEDFVLTIYNSQYKEMRSLHMKTFSDFTMEVQTLCGAFVQMNKAEVKV